MPLFVQSQWEIYSLIMWNDIEVPLAYLISFRTARSWLHGDKRGSIDRFHNGYGSPYLPPNERWWRYNQKRLRAEPVILKGKQRGTIKSAVCETCRIRGWTLLAVNARTNHVHAVVCADRDPDSVLVAFKANATRELRVQGLWRQPFSPWARKGSRRNLWNERSVAAAIDYVLNGQGNDLPDFDD
jgi:REP element-mobilizing transposase RayT